MIDHDSYTQNLSICEIKAWKKIRLERDSNPWLLWYGAVLRPRARFSKAQETFPVSKAISSSSVSENEEVYVPETSCMKRTSMHIKKMWMKQLFNHKVRDFAMAFRVQKVSGALVKQAPDIFFQALISQLVKLFV